MLKVMPELPMMVHDFIDLQNKTARLELASNDEGPGRSGRGRREPSGKSLRYSITGAAVLLSAALLSSAFVVSETADVPLWVGLVALIGTGYLVAGLRRS